MKKFNVYFETENDSGNIIIEAHTKGEAEQAFLEGEKYDVIHVEATEEKKLFNKAISWGDKIIKIEKYDEDHSWFNVENVDGGTCKRPYGKMSVKELIQLRELIDKNIRVLTTDK